MSELIRQMSMFDRPPLRVVETQAARSSDPEPSHLAARRHTASKRRQSNMQAVADLVRRMPGCTSWELAGFIDLGRDTYHEIARRMPDAVTAGAVRKGDCRPCGVTGNLSTTWWPTK